MAAGLYLCYAREDLDRVRPIAEALQHEGFLVWWEHGLPPGKTWDDVLNEGAARSRAVLVFWSKDSVARPWANTTATDRSGGKFIAAALDDAPPPVPESRVKAAPLANWTGDKADRGFRLLVADVARALPLGIPPTGPDPLASRPTQPKAGQTRRPIAAPNRGAILAVIAGAALVALLAIGGYFAYSQFMAPHETQTAAAQSQGAVQRQSAAANAAQTEAAELEQLRRERDEALQALQKMTDEAEARQTPQSRSSQARANQPRTNAANANAPRNEPQAPPRLSGAWTISVQTRGGRSYQFTRLVNIDGTIRDSNGYGGNWTQDGSRFAIRTHPGELYSGVITGNVARGTFTAPGADGTFEMRRAGGGGK